MKKSEGLCLIRVASPLGGDFLAKWDSVHFGGNFVTPMFVIRGSKYTFYHRRDMEPGTANRNFHLISTKDVVED